MTQIASSPRITIVAFSHIQRDGRVLRQIEWLSRHYTVDVIGYGQLSPMPNVQMHSLSESHLPTNLSFGKKILRRLRSGQLLPYAQLLLGRLLPQQAYEAWYWQRQECCQAYELLLDLRPDFIHANDWLTLPLAVRAAEKTDARVVADLHEYAPLELNGFIWHAFLRPLREFILRRYMPSTAASITVNQTIADKYRQVFGFSPVVVMNAPRLNPAISFRPTDPDSIELIHHGGMAQGRNPEQMLRALSLAEQRFHLNFMLVGDPEKITALQSAAESIAPGRVTFHPPVRPNQVSETITRFDLGFYLLPANNYNNAAASPNKFFDFIHAGLGMCIGPSPEMARLCRQYGIGVVAPSFQPQAVAATLNQLSATDIDAMKRAALQTRQELCAEVELEKLLDLYRKLTEEAR